MMFSLIILKPDCVQMKLHGLLISEILAKWDIAAMDLRTFQGAEIHELYRHLRHLPFWDRIKDFMLSGPAVPLIVKSEESSIQEVREYAMQVRNRFVFNVTNRAANIIHSTEKPEDAYRECDLMFPGVQLW